ILEYARGRYRLLWPAAAREARRRYGSGHEHWPEPPHPDPLGERGRAVLVGREHPEFAPTQSAMRKRAAPAAAHCLLPLPVGERVGVRGHRRVLLVAKPLLASPRRPSLLPPRPPRPWGPRLPAPARRSTGSPARPAYPPARRSWR